MTSSGWRVPVAQRPKPDKYAFDLEAALASVLQISSIIPETAFSAVTLGTQRSGSAVLIGADGLVATIGYLVNEAESIWLRTNEGRVAQAHVLGIDQTTGFALVQALGDLRAPVLALGDSDDAQIGEDVVFAGGGGLRRSVAAHVVARQQFAGYWEYLVDNAIFTSPAHPNWGGSAVIGDRGDLVAIGSLQLEQARGDGVSENINMSVPINLLKPVMADIVARGRPDRPSRPWLGVYASEVERKVVLMAITDRSPAKRSQLRAGDVVLAVSGAPVVDLASFYKGLWALGEAGVEAPITLQRDGRRLDITVKTGDRNRLAAAPRLH